MMRKCDATNVLLDMVEIATNKGTYNYLLVESKMAQDQLIMLFV